MAFIWFMAINVATEGHARSILGAFDRTPFQVPHAGLVDPRVGIEHTEDSGWEVHVCPYVEPAEGPDGVSHGGPWHLNDHGHAYTPEEVEDIDATAKVFYDRLGPIHDYRFALTGFECGDWRSVGGLLDDLVPGGLLHKHRDSGHGHNWDGLVITPHLWRAAGEPEGFVPFTAQPYGDYLWIPYTSIANTK
jgi:hypothetical protein